MVSGGLGASQTPFQAFVCRGFRRLFRGVSGGFRGFPEVSGGAPVNAVSKLPLPNHGKTAFLQSSSGVSSARASY